MRTSVREGPRSRRLTLLVPVAPFDRFAFWEANAAGRELTAERIPFPETREYVLRVLDAQRAYRSRYAGELGLR